MLSKGASQAAALAKDVSVTASQKATQVAGNIVSSSFASLYRRQ